MRKVLKNIIYAAILLFAAPFCFGQVPGAAGSAVVGPSVPADSTAAVPDSLKYSATEIGKLLDQASLLHRNYQFDEALDIYDDLMDGVRDSLQLIRIEDAMILTQNAWNMMDFCSSPVVVAKQRFALKDFFLFYPLEDGVWRPVPNPLDTAGTGSIIPAMYIEEDAPEIYYTVQDEDHIRNLYRTEKQDTVWSVPELLSESLTSSSDEILPMLSPDGKSLYFSSKGLYGMGGYDLYYSAWDEEQREWGVPVNMGFPYSSPYDDFLYIDTQDGKYSMFASNRECASDSVVIYVLEYDSTPVRTAVNDPQKLIGLSRLDPIEDITRMDNGSTVNHSHQDHAELNLYTEKLNQVRAITDSLSAFTVSIEEARSRLSNMSGAEKDQLTGMISQKEQQLPLLQDSLKKVRLQVQDIEMQFLMDGVVIDPDMVRKEAEKEVVGASSSYTFTRNNMGVPVDMVVLQPEPKFDYSFMILPEGRFAEDNTLPEGLVYQIQMFAQYRKASVKNLKGLSPVFERKKGSSTYVYSVGVFRTYADVLKNLNKVKRQGFRSAFITAYMDGKPISIKNARIEEKNVKHLYSVRIYPSNGSSLTDSEMALVKVVSSADLVKSTSGGSVSYMLGPFSDKTVAEKTYSMLKTGGLPNVSLESVVQKQ